MRTVALALILLSGSASIATSQSPLPLRDSPQSKFQNRRIQRHPFIRKNVPMPLGYQTPTVGTVTVGVDSKSLLSRFNPNQAFGAGVDSVDIGSYGSDAVTQVYSANNIAAILTAGQRTLSYRLYTELGFQSWHWNPVGKWSDPANGGQGYFVGNAQSNSKIIHSFGFKLPHRGSTTDNASGDGYSRLTDKAETTYTSSSTYWKSNPYLSSHFTGESDTLHPQWVLLDLGKKQSLNEMHIHWANPYATDFTVEYWITKNDNPIDDPTLNGGRWAVFEKGRYSSQTGGDATLNLSSKLVSARYLRIVMTASSGTYDSHGTSDIRNSLGYAIYEIEVGQRSKGVFTDYVKHVAGTKQTKTYVSSTDCWHDKGGQSQGDEQPGLDLALSPKGLSRGLPALVPVAMSFSTPEDAVAEITYLKRKGYPLSGVELGEEPDGQLMSPEDYGALYIQWATQLHKLDSTLALGGPVLSTDSVQFFPDSTGETDWMKRFVVFLNNHSQLPSLNFVSLEHYPLDPNADWTNLYDEPALVDQVFAWIANSGLSPSVPLLITEANVCAGSSEAVVNVMGAVWYADFIGRFLSNGGAASYFYRYEGMPLGSDPNAPYGNSVMFLADPTSLAITSPPESSRVPAKPTAEYFAARILHREWAQITNQPHEVYSAQSDVMDSNGNALVTSYALHRPDGYWSLLLVNRDHDAPHTVSVKFTDSTTHYFVGTVKMFSFGLDNYTWHPNGSDGYADPAGTIVSTPQQGGKGATYLLPKGAVVVLRGRIR